MSDIFDSQIEKKCAYCQHGTKISRKDDIMCPFKGPVSPLYLCKKFIYDPFLRLQPNAPLLTPQFNQDDFSL